MAFVSPRYLTSEWCRREWYLWTDTEIAKHILSNGAALIYLAEVPGLIAQIDGLNEQERLSELEVARRAVRQTEDTASSREQDVATMVCDLRERRQINSNFIGPLTKYGSGAIEQGLVSAELRRLAEDLQLASREFPELATPPRPGYADSWTSSCRMLLRLGLLRLAEGSEAEPRLVRMHHVVQDIVGRSVTPDVNSDHHNDMVMLVQERCNELQRSPSWPIDRWEMEPLDAFARRTVIMEDPRASFFLNRIGERWMDLAEWSRAAPFLRRAYAMVAADAGALAPETLFCANSLGRFMYRTGRLREAGLIWQWVVTTGESVLPKDDRYLMGYRSNLALLLGNTGRADVAEQLCKASLPGSARKDPTLTAL